MMKEEREDDMGPRNLSVFLLTLSLVGVGYISMV